MSIVRPCECPRIDFRVVYFQLVAAKRRVFIEIVPNLTPMRVRVHGVARLSMPVACPARERRAIIIIIDLTLDLYLLLRAGFYHAPASDLLGARFDGRGRFAHAHGGMFWDFFNKNASFSGSALFCSVSVSQFWTFAWTWHGHLDTFRAIWAFYQEKV